MMISIRSLSKSYTDPEGKIIHAVRDCSLDIQGGSFTVFAGRSGCGKTTLLKLIAGLEQPNSGTIKFSANTSGNIELSGNTEQAHDTEQSGGSEYSGNAKQFSGTEQSGGGVPKFGFMFQDLRLLPWLTVEQNLALAFPRPKSKTEKAVMQSEIRRVLTMTGLPDRAASLPKELSGGMAQRAALARCLCRKPEILLLDEPLCSLDAFTRLHLRTELEKLWRQLGLTVILVTHDIEEAVFFGERIFLMNEGKPQSEVSIPLPRPRDYHSAEFQEYCRKIETELLGNGTE